MALNLITKFSFAPIIFIPPQTTLEDVSFINPRVTPFGRNSSGPVTWTIVAPPKAAGPVVFKFTLRADFGNAVDRLRIDFNDNVDPRWSLTVNGRCVLRTVTLAFDAADFNSLFQAGEDLTVLIRPNTVSDSCPNTTQLDASVTYQKSVALDASPYLTWRSFSKTLVGPGTGTGDPRTINGDWRYDRVNGQLLVHHESMLKQTVSGAKTPPLDNNGALPQGFESAGLVSPTTGELGGAIVHFTTGGTCIIT